MLKTAFRHAERSGHIARSPLAGMKVPAGKRREAIPTAAQVEALLAAIPDGNFRDFVLALRRTGCRLNEVATLTADRVDPVARTWRVVDKVRKHTGQTHRVVYLDDAMVELSRRLLAIHPEGLLFRNTRGRGYTRVTVGHRLGRLAQRLGFGPECTAHGLRHLYITDCLEGGMSPATVAELVGHRDTKMVLSIYSHLSERADHLREAARTALPPDRPPHTT
jgi:integrase